LAFVKGASAVSDADTSCGCVGEIGVVEEVLGVVDGAAESAVGGRAALIAIVDDAAGTTRDPVDELIEVGGSTWRFIDTAGIRKRAHQDSGTD
jgi:hypothetical protein